MVEAGKEYNPETASDLRPRTFVFTAHGEQFRYELQVPEYILARLNTETLDRLHDYMNGYARRVVEDGLRGGYAFSEAGRKRMVADVGQHLKNYVWERFAKSQLREGNDCWLVAPSLQKVRES